MQRSVYTTKPVISEQFQIIIIPDEYCFDDDDVLINKLGESLIITPVKALQSTYYEGLSMLNDFMLDDRPGEVPNERIDL